MNCSERAKGSMYFAKSNEFEKRGNVIISFLCFCKVATEIMIPKGRKIL